ncbi:MAG: CDP-diacylglycerol--serine O-phosphatidyltransferase [Candidatus Hydrogenedentes bacterium]|nr:CDP-diacylglycerol--serine O-phosphatidyltransferase [Candidatus Hydrogenedentota bacterium]
MKELLSSKKKRAKIELKGRKATPVNVLASLFTTISLYLGIASIFASIGSEFDKASYLILLAILFDALDGTVAKLTNSVSEFGKQYDSLSDLVAFGVAPGVLVFMLYLPEEFHLNISPRAESIIGKSGSYMSIIYIICAALRLARFNTYEAEFRDSFRGLPSPAAGGTLASFVLFLDYFEPRLEAHQLGPLAYYALAPFAVVLALLMVSSVRYPKDKLKYFIFSPKPAFITLAITAFVLAIIHYAITTSLSIVLFPLMLTYVGFGIGDTFYLYLSSNPTKKGSQEQANLNSFMSSSK